MGKVKILFYKEGVQILHPQRSALTISYKTFSLCDESSIPITSEKLETIECEEIIGFLPVKGIVQVFYVKTKKLACRIMNKKIYQATDIEMVSIISPSNKSKSDKQQQQHQKKAKYLFSMISDFQMYYSHTFNITLNIQRVMNNEKNIDERFYWNKNLNQMYTMKKEWCIVFVDGFIRTTIIKDIDYILFSRRDCSRTGLRFSSRGSDISGNVSNFVETEQILQKGNKISSFVQIRGNIPLIWKTNEEDKFSPKCKFFPTVYQEECLKNHFEKIKKLYGDILVVNLLDNKGSEKELRDFYEFYLNLNDLNYVDYCPFDFHSECANRNYDNVNKLIVMVHKRIKQYGYLMVNNNQIEKKQYGIIRTNCVDCLDRTNVVQTAFSRLILLDQLKHFMNEMNETIIKNNEDFKNIWADHANQMSFRYTKTNAMKTDYTRSGKRGFSGMISDGKTSVKRTLISMKTGQYQKPQYNLDYLLGKKFYINENVEGIKFKCRIKSLSVKNAKPKDFEIIINSIAYYEIRKLICTKILLHDIVACEMTNDPRVILFYCQNTSLPKMLLFDDIKSSCNFIYLITMRFNLTSNVLQSYLRSPIIRSISRSSSPSKPLPNIPTCSPLPLQNKHLPNVPSKRERSNEIFQFNNTTIKKTEKQSNSSRTSFSMKENKLINTKVERSSFSSTKPKMTINCTNLKVTRTSPTLTTSKDYKVLMTTTTTTQRKTFLEKPIFEKVNTKINTIEITLLTWNMKSVDIVPTDSQFQTMILNGVKDIVVIVLKNCTFDNNYYPEHYSQALFIYQRIYKLLTVLVQPYVLIGVQCSETISQCIYVRKEIYHKIHYVEISNVYFEKSKPQKYSKLKSKGSAIMMNIDENAIAFLSIYGLSTINNEDNIFVKSDRNIMTDINDIFFTTFDKNDGNKLVGMKIGIKKISGNIDTNGMIYYKSIWSPISMQEKDLLKIQETQLVKEENRKVIINKIEQSCIYSLITIKDCELPTEIKQNKNIRISFDLIKLKMNNKIERDCRILFISQAIYKVEEVYPYSLKGKEELFSKTELILNNFNNIESRYIIKGIIKHGKEEHEIGRFIIPLRVLIEGECKEECIIYHYQKEVGTCILQLKKIDEKQEKQAVSLHLSPDLVEVE